MVQVVNLFQGVTGFFDDQGRTGGCYDRNRMLNHGHITYTVIFVNLGLQLL